jgi:RNA polymerase sigma factor (sigma-70 family)
MAKSSDNPISQFIRSLGNDHALRNVPDQELLRRFTCELDQAAFTGLVRRHGSMVLNVCRSVGGTDADAEDTFQATFLILAQKANSIRNRASVGSWLYGVGYRTALKARAKLSKRQKNELLAGDPREWADSPALTGGSVGHAAQDLPWNEVQHIIHAELSAFSERYRAPLVLCYLQGRSQEEAARHLGMSKATLRNRLERGREMLRVRLVRRGLGPTALVAIAAWPAAKAGATVPQVLATATVKSATALAAGHTANGLLSAKVAYLLEGGLKTTMLTKWMSCIAAMVACVVVPALGSWAFDSQFAVRSLPGKSADSEPAPKKNAPKAALLFQGQSRKPAADLPRYKFQVGQELSYEGTYQFKDINNSYDETNSIRVWVVAANNDGSHRLIIRQAKTIAVIGAKSPDQEVIALGFCDVFPNGRFERNDSFGHVLNPATVLPRLPIDAGELASGWAARNEFMDETTRYRKAVPKDGDTALVFTANLESIPNAVNNLTDSGVYTFNRDRGLVENIDSTFIEEHGRNGKGHGNLTLKQVNTHAVEWMSQFAAEGAIFFAADKAYREATGESRSNSLAERKSSLEKVPDNLKAARAKLTQEFWQKQVDDLLKDYDRVRKSLVNRGLMGQIALLGNPAAEWTTTDLDGKPCTLKDQRGNVIILDFWYRNCGWCVRSMPQMKQIAERFKDQPVVVFGMNTDDDVKDARFVIDKMGLNYPSLKATIDIQRKYLRGTFGFPTLFIIDQDGVLRDVFEGYSPTLRDEVVSAVEILLRKK